uniref:Uncharacterized protein n=1 Tax=Anguilla anguilla TaxID=7936 RepID=A0A0E9VHL8_ANGAN
MTSLGLAQLKCYKVFYTEQTASRKNN